DPNESLTLTQESITDNFFVFTVPYDTVTQEEGSKTFTVNVNVEGTQRVAHSTVTVVHKQRIAFTEPMGDIKVNEGQALKLSWEDIDPLPETLYQVFLTNVNDPMEERI